MKQIGVLAACAGLLLAAQPALAQDGAAAWAPVQQWVDGMNGGDMAKAAGAYAEQATIIDEFAPHHWTSFAAWGQDADAWFRAGGVTGLHVSMAAPSFKAVEADQAYFVTPTTLSFSVKGKPTTEKGLFTFSTAKTAAGWRITGWAWSTL